MIHDVQGDILLSTAGAIAHGIAPGDDWKQGLALALRERFPSMVSDFRHHARVDKVKPGELWLWSGIGPSGPVRIVNLLTQEPAAKGQHPGPARLEFVNRALKALRNVVISEKLPSVALPRLSTGVGGLKWEDVRPLIEKHLGDVGVPVYVYGTYKKDVAAVEPAAKVTARA